MRNHLFLQGYQVIQSLLSQLNINMDHLLVLLSHRMHDKVAFTFYVGILQIKIRDISVKCGFPHGFYIIGIYRAANKQRINPLYIIAQGGFQRSASLSVMCMVFNSTESPREACGCLRTSIRCSSLRKSAIPSEAMDIACAFDASGRAHQSIKRIKNFSL